MVKVLGAEKIGAGLSFQASEAGWSWVVVKQPEAGKAKK